MHAKQIPTRPKLEKYRKQAKDLFKARRSSEATQRFRKFHPRFNKLPEAEIPNAKVSLADAQWVIAREHAFESWPKFANHLEAIIRSDSQVTRFQLAADAIVTGELMALKSLLQESPELVHARSTREHHAP